MDLQEILSVTVKEVRTFLSTDRATIYQFTSEIEGVITAESVIEPWNSCLGMKITDPCFNLSVADDYKKGKIYQLSDRTKLVHDTCYLELLDKFNIRASLVVPIIFSEENSQDQLWGLLSVNQCSECRQWYDSEMNFLQRLSIQISIAIQQTELYSSLKKVNESLSKEVEERKLLAYKYFKAKQVAESANKAKSLFLANMSHEIRTPMNGVIGMLDILQDSNLNSEQRSQLNIAQSSAESLLSIINDILDFSKVEAGKLELEIIEFNLSEVISNFAQGVALQAQKKGLELILDIENINNVIVKSDPYRLRQILTNLVGNAIKFTNKGEIIIKCNLKTEGEQLVLDTTVQDTGIGIPEDKIDNLFDSFTQVDLSTTRQYGGTGLGLAISQKICQLLGGNITVESQLKKGTIFRFTVKLEVSEKKSSPNQIKDLQNLSLLLVEQNDTCSRILASQLQGWGVRVKVAKNAQSAWNLCQDKIKFDPKMFDVIIIDQMILALNDGELGQKLQKSRCLAPIPLVVMTNHNDTNIPENLRVIRYLTKPIKPHDLLTTLIAIGKKEEHQNENEKMIDQDIQIKYKNDLSQIRILLVEDNKVNQVVIKTLLKKLKIDRVDTAINGVEALTKLIDAPPNSPYNMVFMDCLMPEMDGYQTTTLIRQGAARLHNQQIPIIAMTANAMEGDEQKCLQVGMNDYLSKPVNRVAFTKVLEKFL